MQVHRTQRGLNELRSRERTLNLRERGVLFLADGSRTWNDLLATMQDDGLQVLQDLIGRGYLHVPATAAPGEEPFADSNAAPMAPEPEGAPMQPQIEPAAAVDPFTGKRSLATTRMFLFDLCERMFVRRSPTLANTFREQLREARDREAMLTVARSMLVEVEAVAGAERADAISERISMLLPPED